MILIVQLKQKVVATMVEEHIKGMIRHAIQTRALPELVAQRPVPATVTLQPKLIVQEYTLGMVLPVAQTHVRQPERAARVVHAAYSLALPHALLLLLQDALEFIKVMEQRAKNTVLLTDLAAMMCNVATRYVAVAGRAVLLMVHAAQGMVLPIYVARQLKHVAGRVYRVVARVVMLEPNAVFTMALYLVVHRQALAINLSGDVSKR